MNERLAFSLRTMLGGVALIAAVLGLWVAKPSWQVGFVQVILLAIAPACALVACLEFKGYARAFWIGVAASTILSAMFGLHMVYVAYGAIQNSYVVKGFYWSVLRDGMRHMAKEPFALVLLAPAPVVGLACVAFRWVIGVGQSR